MFLPLTSLFCSFLIPPYPSFRHLLRPQLQPLGVVFHARRGLLLLLLLAAAAASLFKLLLSSPHLLPPHRLLRLFTPALASSSKACRRTR